MCLAALAFAAMGIAIRIASESINTAGIVFLRNLFGLLFLLPFLLKPSSTIKTRHLGMHIIRAVTGLSAMYCFFYTITKIPLATAVLLNYSVPLFTPIIAYYWLRESTAKSTWIIIAIGFVGVYLIVQPHNQTWNIGAITGVLSGLLAGFALSTVRKMRATESSTTIVFYFAVISLIISALPALFTWQTLSAELWLLMLATGLFATVGQLSISKGYQLLEASIASVFTYTTAIWAGLGAWLLWQEIPNALALTGMCIVTASGILVSATNKKRR